MYGINDIFMILIIIAVVCALIAASVLMSTCPRGVNPVFLLSIAFSLIGPCGHRVQMSVINHTGPCLKMFKQWVYRVTLIKYKTKSLNLSMVLRERGWVWGLYARGWRWKVSKCDKWDDFSPFIVFTRWTVIWEISMYWVYIGRSSRHVSTMHKSECNCTASFMYSACLVCTLNVCTLCMYVVYVCTLCMYVMYTCTYVR